MFLYQPTDFNTYYSNKIPYSIWVPTPVQTLYVHDPIGFSMLKTLNPTSWDKVRHLISDFAHSPNLAYEKIEGRQIEQWTACEELQISVP